MTATVLVVERNDDMRDTYSWWLEQAGYHVLTCSGPELPFYNCELDVIGRCRMAEKSHVFIYDPWLHSGPQRYGSDGILSHLREVFPEKPIILIPSGAGVPDDTEQLARADEMVQVMSYAITREELLATVDQMRQRAIPGLE